MPARSAGPIGETLAPIRLPRTISVVMPSHGCDGPLRQPETTRPRYIGFNRFTGTNSLPGTPRCPDAA